MNTTLSTASFIPEMPYVNGLYAQNIASQSLRAYKAKLAFAAVGAIAAYAGCYTGSTNANMPPRMQGSSNAWLARHNTELSQQASAMHNPVVQQFLRANAGADGEAVDAIYKLALQAFNVRQPGDTAFEYWVDIDDNRPYLMLNIEAHMDDLDAQIEKELALRTQIASNDAWLKASQYVVLSIV